MPAATSDLAGALADRMAETRRNQAAAADPAASVWVSANAGTGKTHVLTMRMLRLLLAGTEPARILALTYTKAAAAEMATRVASRLAEWVTASDDELRQRLRELLDGEPSAAETKRARQLFALVIETPGGLKVQTIHAFCERLLQRFPLEAGVPPGFEILDDHTRAALLEEATNQVLTEATRAAPGSPLAEALATAIAFAAESNFDTYLAEALRQRDWLQAAGDDLRAHLTESLGQREWLEAAARLEHDADLHGVEVRLQLIDQPRSGGADDDGDVARLPIHAEKLQHLPALPLLHDHQIEHDQIWLHLPDARQHLCQLDRETIGRNPVALILEQDREQLQNGDRVVDDQNVFLLASLCHDLPWPCPNR